MQDADFVQVTKPWQAAVSNYDRLFLWMWPMGHNLWLYFGVDEHPFATYFDAHQGYRVLTHSHVSCPFGFPVKPIKRRHVTKPRPWAH